MPSLGNIPAIAGGLDPGARFLQGYNIGLQQAAQQAAAAEAQARLEMQAALERERFKEAQRQLMYEAAMRAIQNEYQRQKLALEQREMEERLKTAREQLAARQMAEMLPYAERARSAALFQSFLRSGVDPAAAAAMSQALIGAPVGATALARLKSAEQRKTEPAPATTLEVYDLPGTDYYLMRAPGDTTWRTVQKAKPKEEEGDIPRQFQRTLTPEFVESIRDPVIREKARQMMEKMIAGRAEPVKPLYPPFPMQGVQPAPVQTNVPLQKTYKLRIVGERKKEE